MKLKPCPFCGGKAIFLGGSLEDHRKVFIACEKNCVEQCFIKCREEAIEAWNRREEDDRTGKILDVESLNILPKVPGTWEEWWPGDCALIMTGEEKLYRCSICDAKYPDVEGFNFCPHCGNPIDSKSIHAKLPSNPTVHSYGERDADG